MTVQDNESTFVLNTTQYTISGSTPSRLRFSLWLTIVLGTLSGIASVITILGNITVLLAFRLDSKLRQPRYYFLISLAFCDLLTGMFAMPMFTQYLLQKTWPEELGSTFCDIYLTFDFALVKISQFNIFLITLDRYFSVKIPVKYTNWRTKRKVHFMILFTWCIPTIAYSIVIAGWRYIVDGYQENPEVCDACFLKNPTFTIVFNVFNFWIVLFVMIALYSGIYRIVKDLQKKEQVKYLISHNPTKENGYSLELTDLQPDKSGTNICSSGVDRTAGESTEILKNSDTNYHESTENVMNYVNNCQESTENVKIFSSVQRHNVSWLDWSQKDLSNTLSCLNSPVCGSIARRNSVYNCPTSTGNIIPNPVTREFAEWRVSRWWRGSDLSCTQKTIRTTFFILGAFIVCLIPYHVTVILRSLELSNNEYWYLFVWGLCYLNSLINPICYVLTMKNLKRSVIRILKFDWHRS